MSRLVYINGKFVKEEDAKISIYDSSLMFGDMVFEMTRSFNQKQFKLKEHLERLKAGIKILRIPIDFEINKIEKLCQQVIEKNSSFFKKDDEHRLMIEVSRGILDIYKDETKIFNGPNLIIADFPLRWTVTGMGKLFDDGINAVITSQRAIPSQYLDPKIKNRSRIFYLMANIEASLFKGENNWPLLLDVNGNISEGSGDNFFIIKDNVIISPIGKDILRGISRDYVMNTLSKQLKIKSIEKDIDPYDVYNADEAFMTGTPFCILPVTTLNGIKIKDGKVGPIFNKILKKWSKNCKIDIKKQIQKWNLKDKPPNSKTKITPYSFS
jgi:branched-chain amino acid aminotransferase